MPLNLILFPINTYASEKIIVENIPLSKYACRLFIPNLKIELF